MVASWSLYSKPALGVKTWVALENILFATDFSPSSLASLPYALEIARHYGSTIHLCTVPPHHHGVCLRLRRFLWFWRELVIVPKLMLKLIRSGRLKGVPHQILIREGAVWEVLSAMIQAHQADLVVIGMHEGGRPANLGVGPVAEQVLRWSPCPILSLGPNVSVTAWSEVQLKRILYCTDLTLASRKATSCAVRP
jgi:nucleotide-binding universal stress UspA family protein